MKRQLSGSSRWEIRSPEGNARNAKYEEAPNINGENTFRGNVEEYLGRALEMKSREKVEQVGKFFGEVRR